MTCCTFWRSERAFMMVEIVVVVAILGILAAIAVPTFSKFLNNLRGQGVLSELKEMERAILEFKEAHGHLPDSLADVGLDGLRDPWGNPYVYLRIEGNPMPGLAGKVRKDKKLNPVNTDFDLYSKGPDGKTSTQFMAKNARDDLVRANNGAYFGAAESHAPL